MSDLIEREYLLNIAKQEEAYGYVSEHEILNAPNAETTGALDDAIQEYIKDGYILAEPKVGEWIPCEERMPQKYGKYLTTIESLLEEYSNGVDIIRYGKFTTPDDEEKVGWYFFDEWGEWEATHVIAWQPLPKPYEMERSE